MLDLKGESVTYTPNGGGPVAITGILDFSEQARVREAGIAGTLWVRLSDFPTPPAKNDTVLFDAVTYRVSNEPAEQRDGIGFTLLYLRRKQ